MKEVRRASGAALREVAVAVGVALALIVPSGALAQQGFEGHRFPECFDAVPEAAAVPVGPQVDVHVLVLLDGVGVARAEQVLAAADAPYAAIGVHLVPSFLEVSFEGTDDQQLLAQARTLLGGRRPPSAHLVYVLTSKDIVARDPTGENPGVAGTAACIGGIAVPEYAFAIGEDLADTPDDRAPKIAAHEVGHLLGAHHHYANCAEGLLSGSGPMSPCTIMASMAPRFLSLRFATLSATVVRGYAEEFATPLPQPPPPAGTPPPGGPSSPAPPASRADRLPVAASKRGGSARRANARRSFQLRLRSTQRIRDLVAELRRGSGRRATYARGRLASLDGRGRLTMKVHRRLAAGRYRLSLSGTAASGGRSSKSTSFTFSR